ncbi:MAG: hypothetical protein ACRDJL_02800 [Actinomycetota bacterium]
MEVAHGRQQVVEGFVEGFETGEAQITALQGLREADSHPQGMEHRRRRPPPLLEQTPRGNAPRRSLLVLVAEEHPDETGDLIMVLLACTLARLRDRLCADGYDRAARVVDDLVEVADDYLERLP